MEPQNIYDDPDFLAGYLTLDRQVHGLDGAAEWPVVQSLLPDLDTRRVLDLGCGIGSFSRWAVERGATSVLAVDISTSMLERAEAATADAAARAKIDYRRADLDELELGADCCDIVFSSLTLHYVRDLDHVLSMLGRAIAVGGSLVFSVEHPIYSAPTSQEFETSTDGSRIWPLNNYLVEGERVTDWFVDGVIKEHRTVATYVNAVIDAGFTLERIVEWGPTAEEVATRPERADDRHRPWFLLIQACRQARSS